MAQFSLTIPNELLPALAAEFLIVSAAGGTQATWDLASDQGIVHPGWCQDIGRGVGATGGRCTD
jgi:hypothetical protein